LLARCLSCRKSSPTMLTRSNLIGIPRVIDHNDCTDVQFFLDCFEKYRNTTDKRKLPDEILWYGRASYVQDALRVDLNLHHLRKFWIRSQERKHMFQTPMRQLLGMLSSSSDFTILWQVSEDGQCNLMIAIIFVSHRWGNLQTSGFEYLPKTDSINE
jgi:hypothetical protein